MNNRLKRFVVTSQRDLRNLRIYNSPDILSYGFALHGPFGSQRLLYQSQGSQKLIIPRYFLEVFCLERIEREKLDNKFEISHQIRIKESKCCIQTSIKDIVLTRQTCFFLIALIILSYHVSDVQVANKAGINKFTQIFPPSRARFSAAVDVFYPSIMNNDEDRFHFTFWPRLSGHRTTRISTQYQVQERTYTYNTPKLWK
jgi:hypothetical protein